jgi:RNA-directed DNA polymerase
MAGAPNPGTISTRLQRIANLARQAPGMAFTSLAHFIDVEFLREAYRLTRKDAAVGVDGQTAESYTANLEENLQALLDRFKSGTYKAPPVRRVHIPKNDGTKTRPIGIPTFEDKVLQRAVTMVLEAVYEQDFLDCSYGFRPGRSGHQALETLWQGLMGMKGGWVLEVDIQSFFDTLDHGHLRSFLDQRVRDGVLRRVIGKWLKAGVLEDGAQHYPKTGTPQGGVVSPLLANIYLHEVLDKWFERDIKPRLQGRAFLVRYADDAVLVFARASDARKVMSVLAKRFAKYGLTLHPVKTRLVSFRRPSNRSSDKALDRAPGPETFDLLGFTHYWARSRKGFWVVRRKTAKSRLGGALRRVSQWCRDHRHDPISEQHRMLVLKLNGHYAYYGITGNGKCLEQFLHEVERIWRKWLCRRSRKASLAWSEYLSVLRQFPLPQVRVVHSIYRPAANPCR